MLAAIRMLVVVLALGARAAAVADEPSRAAPNKPDEAAETPAAPPAAEPKATAPDADYADEASDRFSAALEKQNLPYMTPKALSALRAELHDYLKRRVKTQLDGASRAKLLEAMEKFVELLFTGPDSYLSFRANFDSLRWQLWIATEPHELTADELKERERQRQWMFDYMRGLPSVANAPGTPEQQHAVALVTLVHDAFGNPLSPVFLYPMPAAEFEAFTKRLERSRHTTLQNSAGFLFHDAAYAQSQSLRERWPPEFERPRIGQLIGRYTPDAYCCFFVNVNTNVTQWNAGPPRNGEPFYFDVASRCTTLKKGDLWYDDATRRLLPSQGAKMAILDETQWYVIDRVPLADLQKRVREAPVESMPIPEFADVSPPEFLRIVRGLPTLVLENTEGTIVVGRIMPAGDGHILTLQFCYRPLPAYPPFHQAEEGYDEPEVPGHRPNTAAHEIPIVGNLDGDFADVVSDQFLAAFKRQNLPYVTPEALVALRAEMHHYLKLRVKAPPPGQSRTDLVAAMNALVQKKFSGRDSYLTFRIHFDMLKWQLWTAVDRPELTADQLRERDRQRESMRNYIRSLPENKAANRFPTDSREAQLKRLESEVFGNPLSPFFYDAMPAEVFAEYMKKIETGRMQGDQPSPFAMQASASDMFRIAVHFRAQALQKRWPPGFPIGLLNAGDTQDFSFRRLPFDAGALLPQDYNPLTHYTQYKKEGLEFDVAARRLIPTQGAKMATLKETEWHVLDRIPLAELRKQVHENPGESVPLPQFSQPHSPEGLRGMRRLPTVVLETADGKILLVRLLEYSGGSAENVQLRHRPQPAYLPFHPADEGYEEPDMPGSSPIETADALSDRFARALEKQDLPFVGPAELEALRAELNDYLEIRVTAPLLKPTRKAILKAIDNFVPRNFSGPDCYLRFRDQFDALKWQLWTAAERRVDLAPEERRVVFEQRDWMYSYLRQVAIARRASGAPPEEKELQQERDELDREVFSNPLSPFFDEPMDEEEFEAFRRKVMSDNTPAFPRRQLFFAAVYTRIAELKRRWPPGFPTHSVHIQGVRDFDFRGTSGDMHWNSAASQEGKRLLLDAANNDVVEQPPPLDEKATEDWLGETKKGDLWFDPQARRLTAVRGARLATLAESEWYATDRIPVAALRNRVADSPLESYTLPELPATGSADPSAVEKMLRGLPTLVLETAEGKIVLLRIEHYDGGSVSLLGRARPLAPYPPFHAGDDAAELAPAK